MLHKLQLNNTIIYCLNVYPAVLWVYQYMYRLVKNTGSTCTDNDSM